MAQVKPFVRFTVYWRILSGDASDFIIEPRGPAERQLWLNAPDAVIWPSVGRRTR